MQGGADRGVGGDDDDNGIDDPFGGVGMGDGNCNGNSNSGGDALINHQMLQGAMECRGGADRGREGDDDNDRINKHPV